MSGAPLSERVSGAPLSGRLQSGAPLSSRHTERRAQISAAEQKFIGAQLWGRAALLWQVRRGAPQRHAPIIRCSHRWSRESPLISKLFCSVLMDDKSVRALTRLMRLLPREWLHYTRTEAAPCRLLSQDFVALCSFFSFQPCSIAQLSWPLRMRVKERTTINTSQIPRTLDLNSKKSKMRWKRRTLLEGNETKEKYQWKLNVHTYHLQIIIFDSINCCVAEMTSRLFLRPSTPVKYSYRKMNMHGINWYSKALINSHEKTSSYSNIIVIMVSISTIHFLHCKVLAW